MKAMIQNLPLFKRVESFSLLQQITVVFILLGLVIGGTSLYLFNIYVKKSAENILIEQNDRVFHFLAAGSIDAIISEDRPVLETVIHEVIHTDLYIQSITLKNEAGAILVEEENRERLLGTHLVTYFQDIIYEGEKFGSIEIHWDIDAYSGQIQQQTSQIMLMVAAIVFVMTLSFYFLTKHFIVLPVATVNNKIGEMAKGKSFKPIEFNQGTAIEFQNLAGTVNDLQTSNKSKAKMLLELEAAKEKAEASNKAKNKFLTLMSHEIRTPINGIMGMAETLKDENTDFEHGKYINIILDSTENLIGIIDDILDFSRIEKNKLVLVDKPFTLSRLIKQSEGQFEILTKKKNLQFNVITDGDIHQNLLGDFTRLKQVTDNLLSNAFKFTEKGSIELKININKSGVSEHVVHFSITDTGIGIAPENQSKVFEEFKQLDEGYSRTYMGLGIGLTLSQRIVKKMGGGISVSSKQNSGTQFSFDITFKTVTESATKPSRATNNNLSNAIHMHDRKFEILLVEDSVINQQVILAMLKDTPFNITLVNNAKEGVTFMEKIRDRKLDAILMDISTPEMDGVTATKLIRNLPTEYKNIPIIALTAHAYPDDRSYFLASGMNDYIAKPTRKNELISTLLKWVNQSS
ncbi:MAG: response regulator [Alphaproteobacteria bacterium]|nr:response regulator [Alphaproteobacteria bacterium]